jgi:hypothetical protein
MFRKLLLSAVLAVTAIGGIAVAPLAADAAPLPIRHYHVRYEVFYRECGRWCCSGNYGERWEADRAAEFLRHRGFEVRVDCVRF